MKGPVLVNDQEFLESSTGGVSPRTPGSSESIPDAGQAESTGVALAPQAGRSGADEATDKRISRPTGEPLDRDSLEIKLASLIEEMHGEFDAGRPAPGAAEGARVHFAGLLPAAAHTPSDLGAARVVVGAGVDPRTELTVVGRRGPGGEGLILEGIEEEAPLEGSSIERTFVEEMHRSRRKRALSAAAMVAMLVLGCIAGAVFLGPAQSVLLARAGGAAVLAAGGALSRGGSEEVPGLAPQAGSRAGDRSETGKAEASAKDSGRRGVTQAARAPTRSTLTPREVRAPRPSRRAPLGAGPDY